MGMADRVSIDIEGLRDGIESAKDDPLWQELSLSKKVRILLQQQLAQIEKEKTSKSES